MNRMWHLPLGTADSYYVTRSFCAREPDLARPLLFNTHEKLALGNQCSMIEPGYYDCLFDIFRILNGDCKQAIRRAN